ncbi:hypothetical protein VTL71DRAFT_10736 [Oculimacula yallundae]|uniref:Nuclear GTPase SLIP-GC n=1 Tax=Oculimacula yallundae TaxID=86028 RepID=A0ABR4CUZ0_9HELO
MKDKTHKNPPGSVPRVKRKYTKRKIEVKAKRSESPTGWASDLEEKPVETPVSSRNAEIVEDQLESLEVRTHRKEQMVQIGVSFLSRLQALMEKDGWQYPECDAWAEQCMSMKAMGGKPRTLIGVLGVTGAGKSSLLNALVREEELLPTNCMRACTAVVVEVSYNQSNDPQQAYAAEIEFCDAAEWIAEFEILRRDIEDLMEEGSSASESDSELAIATSKLQAVYPGMELSELLAMSREDIVRDPKLAQILNGSSKILYCSTAKALLRSIKEYVDSSNRSSESDSPEYWPLVRLVKIFTKADILKDGLVLVDLPGVGDSNAARGKVAKGYLKNLNHIWIVADTNRAVSEKVAENLLDTTLKEHLYMNESYDDKFVSFITTKTDNINTSEVIRSLDLQDTAMKEDIDREALLSAEHDDATRPPKRKLGDMIDESVGNKPDENRIAILDQELYKLSAAIRLKCIQARNKYTRDRLRIQFMDGVMDLMREFTALDKMSSKSSVMDEAALHNLTGNLNVFTISTKGFQKLLGMFRREPPMPEFRTLEDTGIPDLENFAIWCTMEVREAASDKFLAELASRMPSIRYWAEEGQNEYRLSETQRDHLLRCLEEQTTILKQVEKRANTNMRQNLRRTLNLKLVQACVEAIDAGTSEISATAIAFSKTSGKIRTELAWGTWRAVVRRNGKFEKQNPKLTYDLNKRLTKPFMKPILSPWKILFRNKLPLHHRIYTSLVLEALSNFRLSFKCSIKETCGVFPPLQRIMARVSADQDRVTSSVNSYLKIRQTRAEEARENIPGYIRTSLQPFYTECMLIKGRGSLTRMKDLLRDFVEAHARSMFEQASYATISELKKVDKILIREPSSEVQKILDSIIEDLRHIINTSAAPLQTLEIKKESQNLRNSVLEELQELEDQLTRLMPSYSTDAKASLHTGLAGFKHINLAEEYIEYADENEEEKESF